MTPGIIALLILILLSDPSSQIINTSRRTEWNPGVPGGIATISGPVESVVSHGADSTGTNDCTGAITQALNALPASGGVVFFPRGTYRIKSTISIGKSGVVVRGSGVSQTRLFCDHTGLCFDIVTYKRGGWQRCVDGYTQGSRTVMVEDGSAFRTSGFAEICQANDSSLMYTDKEWKQDWGDSAVGQLFEISQVSGNRITFRTGLHFDFRADLSPKIRPQGFVTGVGFEQLYIERLQTGNSTFQFKNAAYCWVRTIESYHTRKSHITSNTALGCEFRDSYFHNSFSYGDGGSGYGVEFGYHCTDGLVENNIFDSLRHAMMVHVGTNGTVFGYNYSINPVQGEGGSDLNKGWVPPDISLHGHYARMNLFEGNVVQEIGVGDHWGPMGPGNTFLRNVVQGDGIFLYDHSHTQNFVGNVMTKWIDDGTSLHTLRHGERVSGTNVWDAAIDDHTLPVSYYLDSKPDFYDTLQWPSVGADRAGGTIPAWERWKSGNIISGVREKYSKTKKEPQMRLKSIFDRQTFILDFNKKPHVNLHVKMYDSCGRSIPISVVSLTQSGQYLIRFTNKPLASAVYYVSLLCGDTDVSTEMVCIE